MADDATGLSISFNVKSSLLTSQTSSKRSAEESLAELELRKQELNDFGAHLSKLRSLLSSLKEVSFRTVQVPTGRAASAYSPSSLGLDFAAGDDTAVISSVSALSGIDSGNFEINGVSIAVDVASDSLSDVVDRVNAAGAGVTAYLNEDINGLVLVSDRHKEPMELDDGDSGFFSGLDIATGRHKPGAQPVREFRNPGRVEGLINQVVEELNEVFRGVFEHLDEDLLDGAREDLQGAISDAMGGVLADTDEDVLRSGLGLNFNFSTVTSEVATFRRRQFEKAGIEDFEQLADFLFKQPVGNQIGGLVPSLIGTLDEIADSVADNMANALREGALADLTA